MRRTILLLSYWFPPNNVIGASRAAAIAQFFRDRDWEVTVIGADSAAVGHDFVCNLDNINVHRVTDTPVTEFLNFKMGRKRWVRAISAVLRYAVIPDAFSPTTQKMGIVADQLIADGQRFDVVLSTALPFSQHAVATSIAHKTNALLVLDNRDAWACNDYRRRLPLSDGWERRYEHRILSAANMITTISDGMTRHYCNNYPDLADRVFTIRNGVDDTKFANIGEAQRADTGLRIVYTGILYGDKRDIRPVLSAARDSGLQIAFDFYGSEPDCVAGFKAQFPSIEIIDHGRVSRAEAKSAQRNASALLVGLGLDADEKSFLPGKFFEYVGSGKPIIAVADTDYEISKLVESHDLGIATRDPAALTSFLLQLANGGVIPRSHVPAPLTREYQLQLLEGHIQAVLNGMHHGRQQVAHSHETINSGSNGAPR